MELSLHFPPKSQKIKSSYRALPFKWLITTNKRIDIGEKSKGYLYFLSLPPLLHGD
jgi:hypothetical protein